MKKILTLIIVLLGLTFADMIKDHAYVISAIGIKNTTGEIAYISGSTNTPNSDGSYNLVPQVIIYDGTTSYVGAATPFTGCIGNDYYFSSEKKGSCFMGGTMKGATASVNGESGLVPAPVAGQQSLFLRGDGT